MGTLRDAPYVPALRYHWLTRYYDAVVRATTREATFKRALLAQAGIEARHAVLDLGSGSGTLAIWIKLAQPLADVTAVDLDPAILSIAARKAEAAGVVVEFDCARADHLPFADASVDRVVSSLFFHHLTWTQKERTAAELYRILKPGAELHVADWGRAQNTMMRVLFLLVQLLDGFASTQDNVAGRLTDLFEHAGFANTTERRTFSTILGSLTLYSAVKPEAPQTRREAS